MLTQPFFSTFTLIVRGAIRVLVVDKNILLTIVLLILLLQLMPWGRFFNTFRNICIVRTQFFSWLHFLQFTGCPSNLTRISNVFEQGTGLLSNLVCKISNMRCIGPIIWKKDAILLIDTDISAIEHQLRLTRNRPSLSVLLIWQLNVAPKAILVWRHFDIAAAMSDIWSRIENSSSDIIRISGSVPRVVLLNISGLASMSYYSDRRAVLFFRCSLKSLGRPFVTGLTTS